MIKAVRESFPAEDSAYGFLATFDVFFLPDDVSPVKPVTKAWRWTQEAISKNKEYPSIPSYGLDVGLDELVIHQVSQYQEDLLWLTRNLSKPSFGLDLRPDELATHGFAQTQETFLGYITDTGYHPSRSYEVNGGLVKLLSPRFSQTEETFSRDFACSYPSPSYVDLVKRMQEATLKEFGDYRSISSHELDVGPVDPVTDAFAWIQETISKNIGDYLSVPSYELDIGLVKPLTNAFAWIEDGIDVIDNIVSLFHWGYKHGSAIVGGKAVVSEDPGLFLIDPNDTVLSKLLAAINIGGDLATESIDNYFDVKTKAHGKPTPIRFEVIA